MPQLSNNGPLGKVPSTSAMTVLVAAPSRNGSGKSRTNSRVACEPVMQYPYDGGRFQVLVLSPLIAHS